MAFFINAPVSKASMLLNDVQRDLWFHGVTIGQFGFGVLVSRKRQPTKRAADGFTAVPNSNLEVNQTVSAKAVVVRRRR